MGRSVALTAVVGRVAAAAIAAATFFGPTPALADTVVPWVPIGAQAQQKLSIEGVTAVFDPNGYPATGDAVEPNPLVIMNAFTLYKAYGSGEFECFYDIFGGRYYEFASEEEFLAKYRGVLSSSNLIVGNGGDQGPFSYSLALGRDYNVRYENNVEPGQATMIIEGTGDFTGTKTVTFDIYPTNSKAKRIFGQTRYETMEKTVAEAFAAPTTGIAVVASGKNFPDALSASALAGAVDAPIVLTDPGTLTPQAAAQIARLGVTKVYLMGGVAALSPQVEADLVAKGVTCVRVSGADRTETAVVALNAAFEAGAKPDTVIVATGYNFADSLSVSPYSYKTKAPIVLCGADHKLSDATVKAIAAHPEIKRAIIVGGGAAVSEEVEKQQLKPLGITVTRLQGKDRYETSRAIADFEVRAKALGWKSPIIATGKAFPDALAGAPLAARTNAVMLLANQAGDATVTAIGEHKKQVGGSYRVLGGTSAVSGSLTHHIDGLIG